MREVKERDRERERQSVREVKERDRERERQSVREVKERDRQRDVSQRDTNEKNGKVSINISKNGRR